MVCCRYYERNKTNLAGYDLICGRRECVLRDSIATRLSSRETVVVLCVDQRGFVGTRDRTVATKTNSYGVNRAVKGATYLTSPGVLIRYKEH